MNFYENAVDVHETAVILFEHEKYRMSIYNSCLAVELYLKSCLPLVEYDIRLETSHDVVNIYRCLLTRYSSSMNLMPVITMCRKYFNESRYPYDITEVFTKEFASEFINYISAIKFYIDNECTASPDDLKKKYNND